MDSDQQGSGSLLSPHQARLHGDAPAACVLPPRGFGSHWPWLCLGQPSRRRWGEACAHRRETLLLARPCQWKGCPAPAWPQAHVLFRTGTVTLENTHRKAYFKPRESTIQNEQGHTCSQSFPQETVLTWSRAGSLTSPRTRRPGYATGAPGHRALPAGGLRGLGPRVALPARSTGAAGALTWGGARAVWAACSCGAAGVWPSAGPAWAALRLCHPRGAGSPRVLPMLWPPASS